MCAFIYMQCRKYSLCPYANIFDCRKPRLTNQKQALQKRASCVCFFFMCMWCCLEGLRNICCWPQMVFIKQGWRPQTFNCWCIINKFGGVLRKFGECLETLQWNQESQQCAIHLSQQNVDLWIGKDLIELCLSFMLTSSDVACWCVWSS